MIDRRSRLLLPAVAGLAILFAAPTETAEGRIPIPFTAPVTTPIVIDTPGSYVLTRNLAPSGPGPVIRVLATGVTLDLNGHVISPSSSRGIELDMGAEATIRNGTIEGGTYAIFGNPTANATIEDVRISSPSGRGIYLMEPDLVVIRRVTIKDAGSIGIAVEGSPASGSRTEATIEDNLIRGAADGICVFAGGSVEISNNRIKDITAGTFAAGIIVEAVSAALISQNTVEQTTGVTGIHVATADGARLVDNLVSNTVGGVGIFVSSDSSLIAGNVVQSAGSEGMEITGDRNRVRDNVLSNNGVWGLILRASAGVNVMTGNTLYGNGGTIGTGTCYAGLWGTVDYCDEDGPSGDNIFEPDNYVQ